MKIFNIKNFILIGLFYLIFFGNFLIIKKKLLDLLTFFKNKIKIKGK